MNSARAVRTYHSPLRAEQVEQTRERILEAVLALLTDGHEPQVTVAVVARQAGVSQRTVHRYFPTRDDLMDAFNVWLFQHMERPPLPTSVADMPAKAGQLFRSFGASETLLRAAKQAPAYQELRTRRRGLQMPAMRALFPPGTDPGLMAAIGSLFTSDVYLSMRDDWGLSCEAAAEAASQAVAALIGQLDRP